MSGKRSKSTSTSTTGSAQPWANPYAQSGASAVQSVFNQNQPGLQQLTDMTRNDVVNPLLGKFQSSLGTAEQARDYYSGVLSGQGGNPFMDQVLNPLNARVANDANSHFALLGRYGSDAHGSGVARAIAEADAPLLYQDYADTQARKGQAAGALSQGNAVDITQLLAAIGAGAQIPYTGSSNLADSLGALFQGGTETSKSVGQKPGIFDYLAQAAGNAAAAYGGGG